MLHVQNIAHTDSDELTKHFLILCLSFFDQKMTLNEPPKFLLAIAELPGGGVHESFPDAEISKVTRRSRFLFTGATTVGASKKKNNNGKE